MPLPESSPLLLEPDPPRKVVLSVLAPTLVTVILVATLAVLSVRIMGAVRAYVGGESLWAKARANAVQELNEYVRTGDPTRYDAFQNALRVPLGDRNARLALLLPKPDESRAAQGFLEGANHPADIDGLIWLFIHFNDLPQFKEAIDAWIEGDRLIDELRRLGEDVRRDGGSPQSEATRAERLAQIQSVNLQLIDAEKQFSRVLGEISRLTETVLLAGLVTAALILTVLSIIPIRRTLRRQALTQQALTLANERWSQAASVAEIGLFEYDPRLDRLDFDPRARRIFGLEDEPMPVASGTIAALMSEADQGQLRDDVATVLDSGRVLRRSFDIRRPDGETRNLQAIGSRHADRPDHPLVVGVLRDMTDENAQAQLALQRDAAQRVARSQREFLSRLSHELRTPLNAILGFAQLLKLDRKNPLPDNKQAHVAMILEAGQQLHSLVEDVMDLSKVEAGEISMNIQSVDAVAAMRNCIGMVQPTAQRHGVRLIEQFGDRPVWVSADPHRLQQVFINLLTNGCKYNRENGEVTVHMRCGSARTAIEVRDTGVGMSAEELKQIFAPFRRVGKASSRIEGTGLGLYIVKKLVERMQGQVRVDSMAGAGSCFTVMLVSAPPPAPDGTACVTPGHPAQAANPDPDAARPEAPDAALVGPSTHPGGA